MSRQDSRGGTSRRNRGSFSLFGIWRPNSSPRLSLVTRLPTRNRQAGQPLHSG